MPIFVPLSLTFTFKVVQMYLSVLDFCYPKAWPIKWRALLLINAGFTYSKVQIYTVKVCDTTIVKMKQIFEEYFKLLQHQVPFWLQLTHNGWQIFIYENLLHSEIYSIIKYFLHFKYFYETLIIEKYKNSVILDKYEELIYSRKIKIIADKFFKNF